MTAARFLDANHRAGRLADHGISIGPQASGETIVNTAPDDQQIGVALAGEAAHSRWNIANQDAHFGVSTDAFLHFPDLFFRLREQLLFEIFNKGVVLVRRDGVDNLKLGSKLGR